MQVLYAFSVHYVCAYIYTLSDFVLHAYVLCCVLEVYACILSHPSCFYVMYLISSEHKDRCSQEEVDGDSCGSSTAGSLEMDRNPSPPPEEDETEAGEEADAIGETVYSKHWLFSTLTRLIQV